MFGHIPIRKLFYTSSIISLVTIEAIAEFIPGSPEVRLLYLPWIILVTMGLADTFQKKHAIKRNFPLLGRFRYVLESIRPEINQYFVESDLDGRPFDREKRANIYQRAKRALNTHPFGTKKDVYEVGYEWINHSITPKPIPKEAFCVRIGGEKCTQPYNASIFNISAMSYGALSKNAIKALNMGAKAGGFYHNTGEGGLSPYHLEPGGDIVWQIGTGYFGARNLDGTFSEELFAQKAIHPNIKMIEIKLSQGAKPGHGGILPKEKITPEIAAIRHVSMDEDVLSPPYHSAFSTPKELLLFVDKLRELSGGKPVGFKLCMGNPHEFIAICKAMLELNIKPDFITIDGGEGGTGAAPLEFSDSIGTPLDDGLSFAHNILRGFDLRKEIKIIASGKVTTGVNLMSKIALGADICNAARGMMFALGCIQALQCHANTCPTGVATQDPELVKGLVVEDKWHRVMNFHHATVHNFMEIFAAAGLEKLSELSANQIQRRISPTEVKSLAEIYGELPDGVFLHPELIPEKYKHAYEIATPENFKPAYLVAATNY